MIVGSRSEPGRLVWYVKHEREDPTSTAGASIADSTLQFDLPDGWSEEDTHPDLLALSCLLSLRPWIGRRLLMPSGVTATFAYACQSHLGIDVGPVSAGYASRDTTSLPVRTGLAFSGGIDSAAALAVLPSHTVPVFLKRAGRSGGPNTRTQYRSEAAEHAVTALGAYGFTPCTIPTNLELIREPTGFALNNRNSHDAGVMVGCVLLADWHALTHVANGKTAEGAYGIGGLSYTPLDSRPDFVAWQALFRAAGLHWVMPLAGVSEAGTVTIAWQASCLDWAQSCVRGQPGAPCARCYKCARKAFVTAAVTQMWPDDRVLEDLLRARGTQLAFAQVPIDQQAVWGFSLSRYDGSSPPLRELRTRVSSSMSDWSFMERWFSPTADLWTHEIRDGIETQLNRHLRPMSPSDEDSFRSWDQRRASSDPIVQEDARSSLKRMNRLLEACAPSLSEGQPLPAILSGARWRRLWPFARSPL